VTKLLYMILIDFSSDSRSPALLKRSLRSNKPYLAHSLSSYSKISIVRFLLLPIRSTHLSFSSEYVPYVFQVLAQMLELHRGGQVPPDYRGILPLLLTPAVWQQKGSIPGLVRLLKAFLAQDSAQMFASGQIASVLAVAQQRLIPSKINDAWGIELLQAVVLNVKPYVLDHSPFLPLLNELDRSDLLQYIKPVFFTLLTRLQANKTDKFSYLFAKFVLYIMAIDVEGLDPDYFIRTVEEIQPGYAFPVGLRECVYSRALL